MDGSSVLPTPIEHALYGFVISKVLFIGHRFGIFRLLATSEGMSLPVLTKTIGLEMEALERLLLVATSVGLLEKKDNDQYKVKGNLISSFSKDDDAGSYCGDFIDHIEQNTLPLFEYLEEALQKPRAQWTQVWKTGNEDTPFETVSCETLYRDPDCLQTFLSGMWDLGFQLACELVEKIPLLEYKRIIDVGGARFFFNRSVKKTPPS